MTQEDKNLLLQDLCGRLPYGVVVVGVDDNKKPISTAYTLYNLDIRFPWTDCYAVLPYLRPMSSMTEEEEDEYELVCRKSITTQIDWLNKNMFDYRGLIPKGLANAALEGMYNS